MISKEEKLNLDIEYLNNLNIIAVYKNMNDFLSPPIHYKNNKKFKIENGNLEAYKILIKKGVSVVNSLNYTNLTYFLNKEIFEEILEEIIFLERDILNRKIKPASKSKKNKRL